MSQLLLGVLSELLGRRGLAVNCVPFGKPLSLPEPSFPHLYIEDNNKHI